MKKIFFLLSILIVCACTEQNESRITSRLRAPAYPLINIDTYTNAWLFGDTLYKHQPLHWTGKEFPLLGAVRVDGKVYRFLGIENNLLKPVQKMGESEPWKALYVNEAPKSDWMTRNFDDKNWKQGEGTFGKRDNHSINTLWESEHIWVRREFTLDNDLSDQKVFLEYSHDDDVEIYINGIKVVSISDRCQDNASQELKGDALLSLQKGKNVIAAYCRNKGGFAYLDLGLSMEVNGQPCFAETAVQKSAEALPTQTIYNFTCGPVDLEITFTAPLLMDDLELLSRPVNYISYKVKSNDSQSHAVDLYLEAGTAWALNMFNQASQSETFEKNDLL